MTNRIPLLRVVTRNCARPYHVLDRDSVDVDGRKWPRGTWVTPGPSVQPAGQPAIQVVTIRGEDVRFEMEAAETARARLVARWGRDPFEPR